MDKNVNFDIDIELSCGPGFKKVSIDGKDITKRLEKLTINKSIGSIPTVTMTFIPDKCTINGKIPFVTLEKELKNYKTKELINELAKRKEYIPLCQFVNPKVYCEANIDKIADELGKKLKMTAFNMGGIK